MPSLRVTIIKASEYERAITRDRARVVDIPGKGKGVVAKRDIGKDCFIDVYPGGLYLTESWERMVERNETSAQYAMVFPTLVRRHNGVTLAVDQHDSKHTIDPEPVGLVNANVTVAPYINEPGQDQEVNCRMVCDWTSVNMPRIEIRTLKKVKRKEELTLCYGPMYTRSYTTSCTPRDTPMGYILPGGRKQDRDEEDVRQAKRVGPRFQNGKIFPHHFRQDGI
jgi:hypothetical protein